jgi:hypothetical protein
MPKVKAPKFADVLSRAEEIAVAWEAFEVAACINAEEPDRYGMVRRLSAKDQQAYDNIIHMAYRELSGPMTSYANR